MDMRTHTHYVLYNPAYFTFVVRQSSTKAAIIGTIDNFLLYGIPKAYSYSYTVFSRY